MKTFLKELETPCLLIDLEVMDRNLDRMQAKASSYGVNLRPHVKTHKMPELARHQVDKGAQGITVAKVSEAEVMVEAGIEDVFVANQVVAPGKVERLARLARSARVSVGLDSAAGAVVLSDILAGLGQNINYLIEIDSGLGRAGVKPGKPALELYRSIKGRPGLRLKGIFTHAGQVYAQNSIEGVREVSRHESRVMAETAELFARDGVALDVVSVGSTPTVKAWEGFAGANELRPGNYIFNDAMQVALGMAEIQDCALSVLATVISRPTSDRAIIDAGAKTLALDKGGHGQETVTGFGHVLGLTAVIERLSEEHGFVRLGQEDGLEIGQVIQIIPNHACPVVNLFDTCFGLRGGKVSHELKIAARGKSQ